MDKKLIIFSVFIIVCSIIDVICIINLKDDKFTNELFDISKRNLTGNWWKFKK